MNKPTICEYALMYRGEYFTNDARFLEPHRWDAAKYTLERAHQRRDSDPMLAHFEVVRLI